MKPFKQHINTSIFSNDYVNEISLGRCWALWEKTLFSSQVVNNLNVDPDLYIETLKENGFDVTILGTYKTINYPKKNQENEEQLVKQNGTWVETEYITMLDGSILIGVRDESFRIIYDPETPKATIEKIIELYISINNKNE